MADKLSTKGEVEIKQRLERRRKKPLTPVQWDFIKDQGVLDNYKASPLEEEWERWEEFVRGADATVAKLQTFYERRREEEDEAYSRPDNTASRAREELARPIVETRGSKRTEARTEALAAYNRADDTVPQWVYVLQVELWVPAEEMKAEYLELQEVLTEEKARKANPRTLEVARFVWDQQGSVGKQKLSYPELMRRWNESRPDDEKFRRPRSFRNVYIRGKEATLPRYGVSDELLQAEVRDGYGRHLFDSWASDVRATL
jgi:hypothetical protein